MSLIGGAASDVGGAPSGFRCPSRSVRPECHISSSASRGPQVAQSHCLRSVCCAAPLSRRRGLRHKGCRVECTTNVRAFGAAAAGHRTQRSATHRYATRRSASMECAIEQLSALAAGVTLSVRDFERVARRVSVRRALLECLRRGCRRCLLCHRASPRPIARGLSVSAGATRSRRALRVKSRAV